MSLLLDTNVCIGWLKGDRAIQKHWLACEPAQLKTSAVVYAELLYGARKSAKVDGNLERLRRLFDVLPAEPFDEAAAHWYGLVRADLERAGTPIGAHDLMIAATALARDLTVVTRNTREFIRVPGLRVIAWA